MFGVLSSIHLKKSASVMFIDHLKDQVLLGNKLLASQLLIIRDGLVIHGKKLLQQEHNSSPQGGLQRAAKPRAQLLQQRC